MAYLNGNRILNVPFMGGVGQETKEGGEIFNDYEKNIAGCLGFYITTISGTNLTLKGDATSLLDNSINDNRDILGIENAISIQWGTNFDFSCNIVSVIYNSETDLSQVVINKVPAGFTASSANYGWLWVPANPEVGNVPLGTFSHAEGCQTKSSQDCAHSEGYNNIAAGKYAHVEGKDNIAVFAAHAEGESTKALAVRSHTEGIRTTASAEGAHAEGKDTAASGAQSHVEGYCTMALGMRSHAEGYNTKAGGENSHAEGNASKTGQFNGAGEYTSNTGKCAHAEGQSTNAVGNYSHSEGHYTFANGQSSHAEGYGAKANGKCSHAGGYDTKADYDNQTVVGQFNANKPDTLFEVGNGTSSSDRRNAFEVYKDGSIAIGGIKITPEQMKSLLALITK